MLVYSLQFDGEAMSSAEGREHKEGPIQEASRRQLAEARPVVHVSAVDAEALPAHIVAMTTRLRAASSPVVRAPLAPEATADQTCTVRLASTDAGRTFRVLPVSHVNIAPLTWRRGMDGDVRVDIIKETHMEYVIYYTYM